MAAILSRPQCVNNVVPGVGLVPSGNMTFPETMLTKLYEEHVVNLGLLNDGPLLTQIIVVTWWRHQMEAFSA